MVKGHGAGGAAAALFYELCKRYIKHKNTLVI
jgi:hypothetical protein